MPSPYGKNRGPDSYYQHSGEARRYMYQWKGVNFPTQPGIVRRAVAGIPDDLHVQSVEEELGDTLDVQADIDVKYHAESLGDFGYGTSVYKGPEHSKYEASYYGGIDRGWPAAMSMESGRRSVLSTFPDQMKLAYGEPVSLGIFGQLSENEKRLLQVGAVAGAAYLAWKYFSKKGRKKR